MSLPVNQHFIAYHTLYGLHYSRTLSSTIISNKILIAIVTFAKFNETLAVHRSPKGIQALQANHALMITYYVIINSNTYISFLPLGNKLGQETS